MRKESLVSTKLPAVDESAWLAEMKQAVRNPAELLAKLDLPPSTCQGSELALKQFPLFAPLPFVSRMCRGNADDPLLRQLLPVVDETRDVEGFVPDPVADAEYAATAGIIRKYPGRALMIATGSCAIHCRYCFRRHFPYSDAPRTLNEWRDGLQSLANDGDVNELILSGGDPLTLRDHRLAELFELIQEHLPELDRIRIHTRLPIVLPQRVTRGLVQLLAAQEKRVVVVLHANHANEFDDLVGSAVQALRETNALLLNQAVLLRGINDTLARQVDLSDALCKVGVLPYYLHQLDRVSGAAHFECDERLGAEIVRKMGEQLPGYAVPRFVKDVPGNLGKTWLA